MRIRNVTTIFIEIPQAIWGYQRHWCLILMLLLYFLYLAFAIYGIIRRDRRRKRTGLGKKFTKEELCPKGYNQVVIAF